MGGGFFDTPVIIALLPQDMARPDAKSTLAAPSQELLALVQAISTKGWETSPDGLEGFQASPDRGRQIYLVKTGLGAALNFSNCAYSSDDRRGRPDEKSRLMFLNIGSQGISLTLETVASPRSSNVQMIHYGLDGRMRTGNARWLSPALVSRWNRDLLITGTAPRQIDPLATIRAFIAQIQDTDPAKRFAAPSLILPDGSVFEPPAIDEATKP